MVCTTPNYGMYVDRKITKCWKCEADYPGMGSGAGKGEEHGNAPGSGMAPRKGTAPRETVTQEGQDTGVTE